jgi:hypothetical protein
MLVVSVQEEPTLEELVREESGTVLIQDMPARVEMVTINAPLGGDGAHAEVGEARSGDMAEGDASAPMHPRGICLDLVVRSPNPILSGGPAPGEAVQALESLSAVDPRVTKLGLSGYPNASVPPVSYR